MHIKVTFYKSDRRWIARWGDFFGVGDTYYEAIGRLMFVLSAVQQEGVMIELTMEE